MSQIYNIYCDESCHLENDHQKAMVLGAIWCPIKEKQVISNRIRDIKVKYGLKPSFEIKWTKVSPAKFDFYVELLDYFFDVDDLHFRALIVPDKSLLDHPSFGHDHDKWYYKMYFDMLKVIFEPEARYRIYLDLKDTRGGAKVKKLHEMLCNNMYDFSREIIERIQLVRSEEIELLQLADLLIGIISYLNRGLSGSSAKLKLIERMKNRSGYDLTRTTLLREKKVNIFVWKGREAAHA